MENDGKPFYSRDAKVVAGRILDAAEAEFQEMGFAGASTNRIVDRFGGSKGTMFRHFASKSEVFEAVVRRIGERLRAQLDFSALDESEPKAWLEGFARMVLVAILRKDALFVGRMVVAQGRNFSSVRDTFNAIVIDPALRALGERLREWTRTGRLGCLNAEGDAMLFYDCAVSGWLSRSMFGIGPEVDSAFLDREVGRAVAVFLDGRSVR